MNWKNERILVTGACGFIGSHLVETLTAHGARPDSLVIYNARGSSGVLDMLPENVLRKTRIISGDIRDQELMNSIIKKDTTVFHLAALIGIPYSYDAPRSYLDTNITGTMNILNAARQNRAKRVVVVSTSEVYGTALTVPINEDHPLQGQSPYSASKIAAEKLAQSYYCSFGLPVNIVRPFNTYGPRQSARAVIPTIITQLLSGRTQLKLGDPTTTRDFCFVRDTALGLMKIAASEKTIGRTVNIGTGSDISIKDTATMLGTIAGRKISIAKDPKRMRPGKSEVRRLCADNSLLKSLTGWTPPTSLEEGLKETFKWFSSAKQEFDAERYYV